MPAKPNNIIGQRFNRWIVVEYAGGGTWVCICDCGNTKKVWGGNLKAEKSKSCGCLRDEIVSVNSRTHGLSKMPEYRVWAGIKRRCLNKKDNSYPRYGGSGITIAKDWADNFEAFLHDMGKRPSNSHEIDRIDNSKGYEPGNCRWATRLEQAQNKTNNRMISYDGKNMAVAEWARTTGIHRATIEYRLAHGWSAQRALTTPAVIGRNQHS